MRPLPITASPLNVGAVFSSAIGFQPLLVAMTEDVKPLADACPVSQTARVAFPFVSAF